MAGDNLYDDMFNNMGAFGGASGSIPYTGPSAPPMGPVGAQPPNAPTYEEATRRGDSGPQQPNPEPPPAAPAAPQESYLASMMGDIKGLGGPIVKAGYVPVQRASTAGIDRDLEAYKRGTQQRMRGEDTIAAADTELNRNLGIAGGARQTQLAADAATEQAAAKSLQEQLANHEAAMEKARNDYLASSKNMNPYARFTRNTGTTIMSTLSLIMGSAGDAMLGTDKFQKMWNQELDREFEVQKQRLSDKRFALSDMAQQFYRITNGAKSTQEARDRFKAAKTAEFTQFVDNLRLQADGKKVQGRLDQVKGQLQEEGAKFDLGAQEKAYQAHVHENLANAAHGNARELAYANDVNKRGDLMVSAGASLAAAGIRKGGKEGVTVPGYNNPDTGEPLVFDPKEAEGEKGVRVRARNVTDIKSRIGSLRKLLEEANNPALPTTAQRSLKKRGELLARGIASLYSQLNGAGAPISEEIKDAFASMGEAGWYGNTTAIIDELENAVNEGEKEFARGYANPRRNVWDTRPKAVK